MWPAVCFLQPAEGLSCHILCGPNLTFLNSSSRSARFQYDANANPTFPDYETRLAEQQEIAILAVMNEKEALILQKRK